MITVTTGFTVRQDACRTVTDKPLSGAVASEREDHAIPACCVDHTTTYRLQVPFFGPDKTRIPALHGEQGHKAGRMTGQYAESTPSLTTTTDILIFGAMAGGGETNPQALICTFRI